MKLVLIFPQGKEDFHWVKLPLSKDLWCGRVMCNSPSQTATPWCPAYMWLTLIQYHIPAPVPCNEVKTKPSTVKEGSVGSESSSAQNIQWFCVSFPCSQFYTKFEKYRREVRGHRDLQILLSLKVCSSLFPPNPSQTFITIPRIL